MSEDGAASFFLAMRYARRELRGGVAGFRIFIACLALGVAAIAGVGSVSTALTRGLAEKGQDILGGDVDVRLIHRQASAAEYQALARAGTISLAAEMRAMARVDAKGQSAAAQSLVELKAVDGPYPLYGAMVLEPDMPLAAALGRHENRYGLVAEQNLVGRLGAKLGDLIQIGDARFELRAIIRHEPDRIGDGFTLGPRVMIAQEALAATALLQPGSLVTWHYRMRFPDTARSDQALKVFAEKLKRDFPDAGWRIADRNDSAPSMRRFVERVALFLSLVGLTALVVGGVGVANAVSAYLERKRQVIAIFKCLGAPGAFIFRLYLMQIVALALVGITIGLVVGAVLPFLVKIVAGDLMPIPVELGVYAAPLMLALGYGLLTALAFAIWPLARARDVPAASLFRDIVAPERRWPRSRYIAATLGMLVLLAGLAIGFSDDRLFSLWFVLGALSVFCVLMFAARSIAWLAARAPRTNAPDWRLALANIHRPGAPTQAVVLSLGLGLTLLVSVSLINGNLSGEIMRELPGRAPSFFFLDIQPDQTDALEKIVRETVGFEAFERVPMLRGRISSVKGVPADQLHVAPDAQWALSGDRGLTYSSAMPKGSTLASGTWWPDDYSGPLLVSFSDDLAQGFGVKLGDQVGVNVLGREVTATIANTRIIDWGSLGINFIFVFSPGVLSAAPHTDLATVSVAADQEQALETRVTGAFPNITSVRVKEALQSVNSLLENFSFAVQATGMITLVSGILVLAGAMAAGFEARRRDAVILKVLGASRRRILGIYMREYALLGFSTALVASFAGTAAAYSVVAVVMDLPWSFLPLTLLATILGASLVTIALGLAGTWRVLSIPAASVLRSD